MEENKKVFIRGRKGRGSTVIDILTEFGATKTMEISGEAKDTIYFIDHDNNIACTLVNSEMGAIIMDNYREIKLPEDWKDGDILVNNDDPTKFLVKSNTWTGPWINHFSAHLLVDPTSIGESLIAIFCNANYHKADSEELRKFHELLHMHGKEWDAEKKQLVDWKWKPKDHEDYFFFSTDLSVGKTSNDDHPIDVGRIRCGNCFRTSDVAEAMAEKIKKLLKGE